MNEKRDCVELNIDDPAFALLKIQIDNHLRSTISNMVDRNSDEGAISIKIKLKTEEYDLPNRGDLVDRLSVNWTITGQIVEKEQADGNIYDADQYYLSWDDPKHPVLKRIPKAQHEISEYL